jgi:hypothetical protein
MPVYYTLNGRQTDARPFKGLIGMKALKNAEQFVDVFHVEADPVVPNEQHNLIL